MIMGIPLFLLFAIYGVVNAYLPILLSSLGYSATMIGVLQGIFEAAGLVFPIFVSTKVDRKGNYGFVMIILALMLLAVLPPLAGIRNFWMTAAALAVFAVGYKGVVPVSDALVNRILGSDNINYGKVRVLGSIGFVCMTLVLQFTSVVDTASPASIVLWMGIPTVLFILSILLIPGLLGIFPPETQATAVVPPADAVLLGRTFRSRTAVLGEFPRSFWIGNFMIFLGFLGLTPSQRFFSLYVQEYLHMDSYAGLWALSAAAEVPFMFLSAWFIRRFGTKKLIMVSLVAIMLRNLVYAAFPNLGGAVAGQLFHSVCFGLFHPAAVLFVAERAPKRLIAVAMTLYTSVSVGLASVFGNLMGGFIIDTLGWRPLFVFFSIFPVIGCALYALGRSRPARAN